MDQSNDDRSLGRLFGDLSRQLTTLVRQEIDLARTEMSAKAKAAGRDVAMIGAGAALLYAALLALLVTVGLVLIELGLAAWLAALIVAVAVGAIGGVLVMRGRDALARQSLAPERTISTVKDDAEWAKEQLS
ncbi:MAG TPA: phage holin family protein [Candidatus Saccharimonadales bacterium]|nr:phage holin family protein [Candidatus Saccharimonadales bacterium]